jgi:hypothetical protein
LEHLVAFFSIMINIELKDMKKLHLIAFIGVLLLWQSPSRAQVLVNGDGMVNIIGKQRTGSEYQAFVDYWQISQRNDNTQKGIKVFWDRNTGEVTTLILYLEKTKWNDIVFKPFDDVLPYGITRFCDSTCLKQIFGGRPMKRTMRSFEFVKNNIVTKVLYDESSKPKIVSIRFYPYVPDTNAPVLASTPVQKNVTAVNAGPAKTTATTPVSKTVVKADQQNEARNAIEQMRGNSKPIASNYSNATASTSAEPVTATTSSYPPAPGGVSASSNSNWENEKLSVSESTGAVITDEDAPIANVQLIDKAKTYSPFRTAMNKVMESGINKYFENIKSEKRSSTNFWNYKYTYASKVKIPGEKYSLIYSFPFEDSQLDFVSVLYEGAYSSTIETMYNDYKTKLLADFPTSEGWTVVYSPNTDKTKPADMEIKNPKIGSVVLDYHTNPRGQSVLYFRFLLYYN